MVMSNLKINFENYSLSKSMFKQIVADVSYIDTFEVEKKNRQYKESIITLYDIGMDTKTVSRNRY